MTTRPTQDKDAGETPEQIVHGILARNGMVHQKERQLVVEQILERLDAHYKRLYDARFEATVEYLRDWTDFNKHDLGELGKFIRTEYVHNGVAEARRRWYGEQS